MVSPCLDDPAADQGCLLIVGTHNAVDHSSRDTDGAPDGGYGGVMAKLIVRFIDRYKR